MDNKDKERYQNEKTFFDGRAVEIMKSKKKYTLNNTKNYEELFLEIPQLKFIVEFFGNIKDKKVLDLCCGEGWASLYFARSGANVCSCDISPKLIELAQKYAEANGLKDKISAQVMVAENLKYPDNYFDYVFMNAALHHCDIEKVSKEINRVLKKNGKAALVEDNAYHPILYIYRKLTKSKHTKFEKSIKEEDVILFCNSFSSNKILYYRLFNIFDKKYFCTNYLNIIDNWIFKNISTMRKYSRLIGIYVIK